MKRWVSRVGGWVSRVGGGVLLGLVAGGGAWAVGSYGTRAALDGELCAQGTGMVDIDILVCRRAIRAGGFEGPSLATLHNALGRAYRMRGRADKAISEHDAAIALNSGSAVAFHDRALARVARGELRQAAGDLDRALALFPGYGEAWRARGRVAFQAGDPEAATAFLDAATALRPGNAESYAFRGFSHFQLGAYRRAAADFQAAISRNLNFPYTSLWLSLSLQRQGEPEARWHAVLEPVAGALEGDEWPRPLLEVYLGRTEAGQLLDDAAPGGARLGERRRYESRFYMAMAAAGAGRVGTARELLDAVLQMAPPLSLEAVMARQQRSKLTR